MRTTDDLNPERFQPLGSPVKSPTPQTPVRSDPVGPSGFVTDPDGKTRTTTHKPYASFDVDMAALYWSAFSAGMP